MNFDSELDPAAVEIGGFFPQAPELVWRALTESDLVEQWLMRSIGLLPSVGTHFLFVVPTEPSAEIACEVLEARPTRQLSYSWVDLRARHPARWVVEWGLETQGRGSRVLLTQTGFDIGDRRQKMARNAMERGWRGALSRLGGVLDRIEA
ncbi:SRPBCC family protein [Nocardia spumae]|uniref:SRPBCC family protein n=1 Tax=Nocardia spumae TaxID=2887190 RepID=UPI001D137EC6|nr:SRPBCC domain-containing protein [Nocardia spumae]